MYNPTNEMFGPEMERGPLTELIKERGAKDEESVREMSIYLERKQQEETSDESEARVDVAMEQVDILLEAGQINHALFELYSMKYLADQEGLPEKSKELEAKIESMFTQADARLAFLMIEYADEYIARDERAAALGYLDIAWSVANRMRDVDAFNAVNDKLDELGIE